MLSLGNIIRKSQPLLFWCMRGLGKSKREAFYTLFAFCSHIENILHSSMPEAEKTELLQAWQEELINIYEKKVPQSDIGRKIYKNCLRFNLPQHLLAEMINSALLDAEPPLQAPPQNVLAAYLRGMAVVPFQLALTIIDEEHPMVNAELAKNLGYAVMVTLMLRNIKDDANDGHFYIPSEILAAADLPKSSPREMVENKNISQARADFAAIAELAYAKAERLLSKMNKTDTLPLRLIKNMGRYQFEIMQKRGWEIISPKPRLDFIKRLHILYQTLVK